MASGSEKSYSRSEKSLSTLTKKFVEMLQSDPSLDLNVACNSMDVQKKRRIYDITNVLEGINLIKKNGKNSYSWTGRRDRIRSEDMTSDADDRLDHLKLMAADLQNEELELDNAIRTMSMNIEASKANSSYCYLSRLDFIKAFGSSSTLLVAKDYQNMKIQIPNDPTYVQSNSQRRKGGAVQIEGDVIRPVQLLLVNSGVKQSFDSNLLFCLDEMASDDEISQETVKVKHPEKARKKIRSHFLDMTLFRRRMKCKSFLELTETERESMATVLKHDKYRDKSRFHYISQNKLILPSDYDEPDFKTVDLPVDIDYQDNYSIEAPSIHDLFDLAIDPDIIFEPEYEEYLEEDMEFDL